MSASAGRGRRRVVVVAAVLFVVLVVGALAGLLLLLHGGGSGSGDGFRLAEQAFVHNVDDAGVGDLDDDGALDRWTTNHSSLQWIDLGAGGTEPGADVAVLGLWNDRTVPGLEASGRAVVGDRPARIWFDDAELVVEGGGLGDEVVAGQVEFPWELTGTSSGSGTLAVERCDGGGGVPCWRASFSVADGGAVRIVTVPPDSNGFPVTFSFDESTDLSLVQLGSEGVAPPDRRFTWRSRDRHGLALATLAGESRPSLFVSRGAARGRIAEVDPGARDELFEWRDGELVDRAEARGIVKEACPGRQVAWQDVDEDGLVDLYVVCGRGDQAEVGAAVPNQLHLQQPDGTFVEDAARFGLDLDAAGTFAFVRVGPGCGDLALLYVAEEAIELYVRGDERFDRAWSTPRAGEQNDQVVVADLDDDGVWEALVFSKRGNAVVEIAVEGPEVVDPAALGLPAASLAGAVGDVDGDGALDVVAAPQGVFRGEDGGFERAGDLDFEWASAFTAMRVALYDHDGDGDLDLWALSRDGGLLPGAVRSAIDRLPTAWQARVGGWLGRERLERGFWDARLFENVLDGQDTVRLELEGPPSNPDAIGAVVEVSLVGDGGERVVRTYPGVADSSLLSMTHLGLRVDVPPGHEVGDVRVHCVDATATVERPAAGG